MNIDESFFKVMGLSKYKTNYFDMEQIKIESMKNKKAKINIEKELEVKYELNLFN